MSGLWGKLFRRSQDIGNCDYSSQSGGSSSSDSSTEGLPSSRYRHTNWSDLPDTAGVVRGDQLRSPRVRQAPLPGDASFEGRPPEARSFYNELRVTAEEKVVVRKLNEELSFVENWELAIDVNFSYQNLGDPYQEVNFGRIMRRLAACQRLTLINNHLTCVNMYTLPSCVYLVLTKNHIKSFKDLPKLPMIQHLSLTENAIESLDGLKSTLGRSSLLTLKMQGNPVVFTPGYRRKVFEAVPSLQVLDGVRCRPTDRLEADAGSR